MWNNFDGKPYSRDQLAAHITSLDFSNWHRKDGTRGRPKYIVLHNTSDPTIDLWLSWSPQKRSDYIRNVQGYYENDLGWRAGPHFFVPPDQNICAFGFSDPTTCGTHASCFNSDSIGIEMVGEFNEEAFDQGPGALVRDNAIYLAALLHNKLGLQPEPYAYAKQGLHFHIECTADNHDCPGSFVQKPDVVQRIKDKMADLHATPISVTSRPAFARTGAAPFTTFAAPRAPAALSIAPSTRASAIAAGISPTRASAIAAATVSATTFSVTDVQNALTELGLLDPPADGQFGPVSRWALAEAIKPFGLPLPQEEEPISQAIWDAVRQAQPLPLNPFNDFAGKVVTAMQHNGYWINRHPDCFNIVYVEGMDVDGTPNQDLPNHFDSVRMLIRVLGGVPEIVGRWEATTEPSKYWTENPMNPLGAARIAFGQYKAWANGEYHGFPALLQVSDITVYRDKDKIYKRYGPTYTGDFGIHNHQGYDYPRNDEGRSSAGCLVGRLNDGHRDFMRLVQTDKRFMANNGYHFMVTVMPASDVVATA